MNITYCDLKTKKQVQRDILALDDRIERVNLWRNLSEKEWENGIDRLMMEPMYIMAEGQLMRTTLREWVEFSARNIDFTKKRNGRMA